MGDPSSGIWSFDTGRKQGRLLPVYYSCHVGPLNAAGFIGVLEKKDSTWVLHFWRRLWIS